MEDTQLIERELKKFIKTIVPMMIELGMTETEIVEAALRTLINDDSEEGAKARKWTIEALKESLENNTIEI